MINIVTLPYDWRMTYIAGMHSDDGVILVSDSMVREIKPTTKESIVSYTKPKVHSLAPHIAVGFAGIVTNVYGLVDTYRAFLKASPDLTRSAEDVSNAVFQATVQGSLRALEEYGSDIEMIIGGYSLDENLKPIKAQIFYLNASSDIRALEYGVPVQAGYKPKESGYLQKLYEKSPKDYESLRKICIKTVEQAKRDNPKDVAGKIQIKHITKSGISEEII